MTATVGACGTVCSALDSDSPATHIVAANTKALNLHIWLGWCVRQAPVACLIAAICAGHFVWPMHFITLCTLSNAVQRSTQACACRGNLSRLGYAPDTPKGPWAPPATFGQRSWAQFRVYSFRELLCKANHATQNDIPAGMSSTRRQSTKARRHRAKPFNSQLLHPFARQHVVSQESGASAMKNFRVMANRHVVQGKAQRKSAAPEWLSLACESRLYCQPSVRSLPRRGPCSTSDRENACFWRRFFQAPVHRCTACRWPANPDRGC